MSLRANMEGCESSTLCFSLLVMCWTYTMNRCFQQHAGHPLLNPFSSTGTVPKSNMLTLSEMSKTCKGARCERAPSNEPWSLTLETLKTYTQRRHSRLQLSESVFFGRYYTMFTKLANAKTPSLAGESDYTAFLIMTGFIFMGELNGQGLLNCRVTWSWVGIRSCMDWGKNKDQFRWRASWRGFGGYVPT